MNKIRSCFSGQGFKPVLLVSNWASGSLDRQLEIELVTG